MKNPISLRLPQAMMSELHGHLFPGDGDEHGAVIGFVVVETDRGFRFLGRRLFLATDGVDYLPGQLGYRMLTPEFVLRCALACADEGLGYLAVHNHYGTDSVAFSSDDMASHRRGYPALLDILDGPPAGALVFAGQAVAGDIWFSRQNQRELDHALVVGRTLEMMYPSPRAPRATDSQYGRQVQLLGGRGQDILAAQKVGIVGAGGAGSLISEFLARLGIGHLVVVDFDRLEATNCPRVVGAKRSDLRSRWLPTLIARLLRHKAKHKVEIARRVAREANPGIRFEAIAGDISDPTVVQRLIDCDAVFLAADTMQARLVVNALCHQYLIPTWQVGAKVQIDSPTGKIQDVFSAMRQLVPGKTCLWCNELIDSTRLAEEGASPEQRRAQQYVDEVPAPSVITLNAVAAANSVNDYLFAVLGLFDADQKVTWTKCRPLEPQPVVELPRQGPACTECIGRLGMGRLKPLPVRE